MRKAHPNQTEENGFENERNGDYVVIPPGLAYTKSMDETTSRGDDRQKV